MESNLRKLICEQITTDLTIGKMDNGESPYSNNEIDLFIESNQELIQQTIDKLINAYKEDNDIESLNNPEKDWITEYLYDFISIP